MDRLLYSLELNHYFSLVMYISASVGLIVSIVKRKKFPVLKYFPIYFLLSLIQSTLDIVHFITMQPFWYRISIAAVNIFVVFEFFIITNFFFKLKLSKKIEKAIGISSVAFYAIALVIWVKEKTICVYPHEIYILEAALIIPLTLSYFYVLFKEPPIKELVKDFAFWISTGLLFFFATTLPLFLIQQRLEPQVFYLIYPIAYLAYAILFALIIKAYLCKPELVK